MKNPQCQRLDSDGVQCKNTALKQYEYFGNTEHYPYHYRHIKKPKERLIPLERRDVQWVKVWLCKKHKI